MARNAITDPALRAKWSGADKRLNDGGSRGGGRLVAIVRKSGPVFYFAYFDESKTRRHLPIGWYDSSGRRGLTLQRARDEAAKWSALYRGGNLDLHEYVERQREDAERAHKEKKEALQSAEQRSRSATLRQLLDIYVAHLERSGKDTDAKVRGLFKLHVFEAKPDLADRRAAEIPVDEFVELIGRLVEADKGRTAAKLRSYLRAAYALAIRAKTDAAVPMVLRTFGIEANPLASIAALSQFNNERDRTLSSVELAAFLRRLDTLKGLSRDAALLGLLLGGQRPTQLLRAGPLDVDLDGATITLTDKKGRRRKPRRHEVPFGEQAVGILRRRLDALPEGAERIFASMSTTTVTRFVAQVSENMMKAKEIAEPFQLRDLRRTAETQLAAIGVSKDIRAQLLSHGLGGVQAQSYDRHTYALEKRATIEKWERHLKKLVAGRSAEVTPIRRDERAL